MMLKISYLKLCNLFFFLFYLYNIMFKKITNKKLLISLVIVIVAVIFNKQILEGFRQGRRFFLGIFPSFQ